MKANPHKIHTTADELLFIQTIGQTHEKTKTMKRKDLLTKYFNASLLRDNWGSMDKYKVLAFLQDEINLA